MRIFRASCILLAYLFLLLLGTPGLDFLPPRYLQSAQAKEAMTQAYGSLTTQIATAAADLNRSRLKLEKHIGKIQPIFRVAQSWHLYRDGPSTIRRMEISHSRMGVDWNPLSGNREVPIREWGFTIREWGFPIRRMGISHLRMGNLLKVTLEK